MTHIVERLRFDAARCELQFSKGVAMNIEEAAARIEQLEAALRETLARYMDHDARQTSRIEQLEAALRAIIIRCEEGDKKSDWLPTISNIARAALAPEQEK
jgi:hypothetical protein